MVFTSAITEAEAPSAIEIFTADARPGEIEDNDVKKRPGKTSHYIN